MDLSLSLNNIINITLSAAPAAISEKNVNNLMLFTNETPGNADPYTVYRRASDVGTDYGSSSVTKAMADAIFSQTKNILSGGGQLIIAPLQSAVSATSGYFTTADIFANLANIIAVSDGDLKVTLDQVAINLTGLDFTACTTWADVIAVLQEELGNAIVTVTDGTTTALVKVTSKKVGADADVVLGQVSGGGGTDLSGANYFNTAAGAATSGANSSGEAILTAITRLEGSVHFCGVITNVNLEDTAISTIAAGVQSTGRIFLHHFCSTADIAGIGTTIQAASYTRTRCLLYTVSQATANLMKAAYAGRAFSTNFSGSNTCQTMNLKTLTGITADVGISQTNYTAAKVAGMDCYVSYEGVAAVLSTGGNLFFDQVYNRLALEFALQAAGFNALRVTGTKIPQTEQGINALKNAYGRVFAKFVINGYIGVGLAWNSSETFGVPEDLVRNILDYGFYIYSLPIAEQDQDDRDAREAPLIQCALKEAGAIHSSDVNVVVQA